jgi:hypothetical protein
VPRPVGAQLVVLLDGDQVSLLRDRRIGSDNEHRPFSWTSDGKPHWIRIDVRGADGKLILLGNPIYLGRKD